jgi:hypothetical protein
MSGAVCRRSLDRRVRVFPRKSSSRAAIQKDRHCSQTMAVGRMKSLKALRPLSKPTGFPTPCCFQVPAAAVVCPRPCCCGGTACLNVGDNRIKFACSTVANVIKKGQHFPHAWEDRKGKRGRGKRLPPKSACGMVKTGLCGPTFCCCQGASGLGVGAKVQDYFR